MIGKEDLELIKKIQSGDKKAEKELFFKFGSKIARQVNYQLGANNEDWKDVAGDIQLAVLIAIREGNFDAEKGISLGSYIYGITSNKIKDYFKLIARKKVWTIDVSMDSFESSAEEFEFERQEMKKILRNALKKLKFKYKEVLYLRYYKELSVKEISIKLKLPPRRVSERINYALKLLRIEYKK